MRSHGISTFISGSLRGHERISGPAGAAAASENLFHVGVDQHGARARHPNAGEDHLHGGEAALVRLPGSAKGALRHRDLWGLSIRKDDSSQQNYQGAGRSMGHPTIHGLILQVNFSLVVL